MTTEPIGGGHVRPAGGAEGALLLLRVKNLSKSFGDLKVLKGLSLDLGPGRVVAITGPNGSGKSVFLDILSGFTAPDESGGSCGPRSSAGEPKGDFAAGAATLFRGPEHDLGINLIGLPADAVARNGVARTFQKPIAPRMLTVKECVSLALDGGESESVAELLARFELEKDSDVLVGALSFGKRKLVDLACAFARKPQLALLDEPFTALSPRARQRLHHEITQLRKRGGSVLFVEHDRAEIQLWSDEERELRDGYLAEREPEKDPAQAAPQAADATTLERESEPSGGDGDRGGLYLRNLNASYGAESEEEAVIWNLSLAVAPGELVGVVGLNGSGKSTLLRLIAGHLTPFARHERERKPEENRSRESTMSWEGTELEWGQPWTRIGRGVVLVSQERAVFGQLTVAANLRLAGSIRRLKWDEIIQRAADWWPEVSTRLRDQVQVLSAGEYRRLSMAMAMLCDPKLLLLDEPLAGVDSEGQSFFGNQLGQWASSEGRCALIVEQDLDGLKRIGAKRVVMLSRGGVHCPYRGEDWDVTKVRRALSALARGENIAEESPRSKGAQAPAAGTSGEDEVEVA